MDESALWCERSDVTFEAAILARSRSAVTVQGLLLRGISTRVVTPPAAAAWVAVTKPVPNQGMAQSCAVGSRLSLAC